MAGQQSTPTAAVKKVLLSQSVWGDMYPLMLLAEAQPETQGKNGSTGSWRLDKALLAYDTTKDAPFLQTDTRLCEGA